MSKVFSVKRSLLCTAIPYFRQYVTVIGSAHLDIFGEFDSSAEQQIDKRGKISYSIGGGAYNVAANLAQHNIWVYLCTGLAKNSYISSLLRDKIKENRIAAKFVEFHQGIGESGFVAHRNTQTHNLSTAVSCMAVESVQFDNKKLRKAISKSRLVIVDCNLSDSTLQQIVDISASETPPIQVMVTGISESKIKRVQHVDSDSIPAFEVIVARAEDVFAVLNKKIHQPDDKAQLDQHKNIYINEVHTIVVSDSMDASPMHYVNSVDNSDCISHEATLADKKRENARNFFHNFHKIKSDDSLNNDPALTICAALNARYVIVVDGIKGYWILCRKHSKVEFFPLFDLQDIPIATTSGCIEALLAAVADHVLEYGCIDTQDHHALNQDHHALNRLRTRIEDYVRRVINVTSSTVGAELSWNDETDSAIKIFSANFRRGIKENIGKVGLGIGAAFTAIISQLITDYFQR